MNKKSVFSSLVFTALYLSQLTAIGQEPSKAKPLSSTIDEVTVFLQGAQVVRNAEAQLSSGKTTYKFSGLSAYLDPTSVQLQGIGTFTVLSVTPKFNYLDEDKISDQTSGLRDTFNTLRDKKENLQNEVLILDDQESFLLANRLVKGQNSNLAAGDFEQITTFFYAQMAQISRKTLELGREIKSLNEQMRKYQNQINAIQGKELDKTTDVYVEVIAEKAAKAQFRLSYYVYAAGWTPSYDLRVDNITSPLSLIYKARVYQNSGEDWKNVKMTFSNANPNESGNLPDLQPYYLELGYNYRRTNANQANKPKTTLYYLGMEQKQVRGTITDEQGEPVPYATITVYGTTIGTFSDAEGNFAISVPSNINNLQISAIGYNNVALAITGDYLTVSMKEVALQFESVVVTKSRQRNLQGVVATSVTPTRIGRANSRKNKSSSFRMDKADFGYHDLNADYKVQSTPVVENQTTIEFTVEEPYTVLSKSKPFTINMKELTIPANYEYRTVPKLEAAAYLVAQVTDWSQYQLLEGIANLYFENTFIGQSALDVQYFSDTLDISLGKDKNVIVKRTKVKDFSGKQFLGSDIIARRQYEIELRNNKSSAIEVVVYDQIPLTTTKNISVDVKEISGAKRDETTGELEWRLKLDPSKTQKLSFKYSVQYPGGQLINLE